MRSTDVVGVGGGDVSSEKKEKEKKKKKKKKVPTDIAKAVLRARFATWFPRAADKRLCAGMGKWVHESRSDGAMVERV